MRLAVLPCPASFPLGKLGRGGDGPLRLSIHLPICSIHRSGIAPKDSPSGVSGVGLTNPLPGCSRRGDCPHQNLFPSPIKGSLKSLPQGSNSLRAAGKGMSIANSERSSSASNRNSRLDPGRGKVPTTPTDGAPHLKELGTLRESACGSVTHTVKP